jgi:hypothetical protein
MIQIDPQEKSDFHQHLVREFVDAINEQNWDNLNGLKQLGHFNSQT